MNGFTDWTVNLYFNHGVNDIIYSESGNPGPNLPMYVQLPYNNPVVMHQLITQKH